MPRKRCAKVLSTGRCRKNAIEGSDRCIFHDATMWQREPDFLRNKVKEQIERGNLNFVGYHFPKINFSEMVESQEFKGTADFSHAHFHGETDFRNFRFKDVDFKGTKFDAEADFCNANFFSTVNFENARFLREAYFFHSRFPEVTYFSEAEFHDIAGFRYSRFGELADFIGTRFLAGAYFRDTIFSGEVVFSYARFLGDTSDFRNARFKGPTDFVGSKFIGKVYFWNTTFAGNVSFSGISVENVLFDFSFSVFHGGLFLDETRWAWKNYKLKIEEVDLEIAIRNYHLLKNVFLAMGHYRVAGDLYYNEMACRRKLLSKSLRKSLPNLSDTLKSIGNMPHLKNVVRSSILRLIRETQVVKEVLCRVSRQNIRNRDSWPKQSFRKQFFDWIWMQISYFTCGFGERPMRVVGLSFATVLLFTLAYHLLIPTSLITAIYLSCDCFVTLGIFKSELVPMVYRWLTYLEAGLGLFMMSLFLVVFSRKMARD